MRFFIAIVLIMSAFTSTAFAAEPTVKYAKAAKSAVVSLYGRPGDQVNVELKAVHSDGSEVHHVTLSNGANVGSVVYQVQVSEAGGEVSEGKEVATISIKYLISN